MATKREEELERELERVRGLLQRQSVPKRLRWWYTIADLPPLPYTSGGTMQPWPDDQKVYDANGKDALSRNWKESCAARGFMVMTANYVHELLTATSGAESADIGKLDSADKTKEKSMAYTIIHENMTEPFDKLSNHLQDCCGGCPYCVELCQQVVDEAQAISNSKAGSAETGGEKAAPHGKHWAPHGSVEVCLLCRCSLSGDKMCSFQCACHDPEPANFPRTSQNQTASSGVEGAHEGITADKSVALAESSLSSPPPRGFCIGARCRGCAQCE